MKKVFIPAILFLCSLSAMSQQLPEVSYFMYDYSRTNPGSLGSNDMVNFTLIGKTVFANFPGHPQDVYLDTDVPFNLFGAKHGVGLSVLQDQIGFYTKLDAKLGYAFRFSVGDGTLGIGVGGSYQEHKIKPDWVGAGAIDPANDPDIPQGTADIGIKGFGISAGLFYRTEDIYFGASVLNIYSSEVNYAKNATSTAGSTATEQLKPHYYLTAGYNVQLANPVFELQPAINLYSDGTIVTFDLNTTLTYNKKIWGGVSYRAGSSVIGMLGLMIIDGLKVGYAYDFQTSAMNRYSTGSHEILVNYSFKLGTDKSPQRYKSIRYL